MGCAVITAETGAEPGLSTTSCALRAFSLLPLPPKAHVLLSEAGSAPESVIPFDPSGKDWDGCRRTLSLAHGVSWAVQTTGSSGEWASLLPEGGASCLELRKMWLGKAKGRRAEKGIWGPSILQQEQHRLMAET